MDRIIGRLPVVVLDTDDNGRFRGTCFHISSSSTVNGLPVLALTTDNRADGALFRRRNYLLSEGIKTPGAGLTMCGC